MSLRPNGIHHLAISTCNIKEQIEFFTDVLGGELKALYWMHGVDQTFHGFVAFGGLHIAFVQHPENPDVQEIGLTHPGNAGGRVAAGVMQHVALNVDSLDELLEMRDRLRSRNVVVMGPLDHGMCHSIYFAGPEGLVLEIATGPEIDERAWIDPEVQALAGISDEELKGYLAPAEYQRPAQPVPQPAYDPSRPHLLYPPKAYERILTAPDESFLHSVTNEPPVKVG